jgi:hypothetical protein
MTKGKKAVEDQKLYEVERRKSEVMITVEIERKRSDDKGSRRLKL